MSKNLSPAKLRTLGPLVLERIKDACREHEPTPTYHDLVSACRAQGARAAESDMSAVLDMLEGQGVISREGSRYRFVYCTADGSTSMRAASGGPSQVERPSKRPTLEERAAWAGVRLQMSHPSERHIMPDRRLPSRWGVSGAGRWGSPLS